MGIHQGCFRHRQSCAQFVQHLVQDDKLQTAPHGSKCMVNAWQNLRRPKEGRPPVPGSHCFHGLLLLHMHRNMVGKLRVLATTVSSGGTQDVQCFPLCPLQPSQSQVLAWTGSAHKFVFFIYQPAPRPARNMGYAFFKNCILPSRLAEERQKGPCLLCEPTHSPAWDSWLPMATK